MRLTVNDPNNDRYVILLNGKPIRTAVAADSDEGWVDIVDITAMVPPIAPLDESDEPGGDTDAAGWEQIPLKRLTGEVEIREV